MDLNLCGKAQKSQSLKHKKQPHSQTQRFNLLVYLGVGGG